MWYDSGVWMWSVRIWMWFWFVMPPIDVSENVNRTNHILESMTGRG